MESTLDVDACRRLARRVVIKRIDQGQPIEPWRGKTWDRMLFWCSLGDVDPERVAVRMTRTPRRG